MIYYLKMAFQAIVDAFAAIASTLIGALFSLMPTETNPATSELIAYVQVVNVFVPLDFGAGLLIAYYAWNGIWLVYKHVKSYIPTIGTS